MDISINFKERSYGGKKFRPQPHVYQEKANNLLLCITAWGQPAIADKVSDSIKNFITLASDDVDVTVAYARKENLQKMGNTLRMAVITASEKIYNEFNKEEYTSGFEIFAAVQEGPQWSYVSCGQPSVVLCREKVGAMTLSQNIDMNVLTPKSSLNDPLPNHLLGLGQHPPIHYGSLRLKSSDRLALISRTYLPNHFFKLTMERFDEDHISRALATESPEVPFWLGLVGVN